MNSIEHKSDLMHLLSTLKEFPAPRAAAQSQFPEIGNFLYVLSFWFRTSGKIVLFLETISTYKSDEEQSVLVSSAAKYNLNEVASERIHNLRNSLIKNAVSVELFSFHQVDQSLSNLSSITEILGGSLFNFYHYD